MQMAGGWRVVWGPKQRSSGGGGGRVGLAAPAVAQMMTETMKMTPMPTHLLVALKEDDTATLVAGCEVVSGVVKLDGGDDVG